MTLQQWKEQEYQQAAERDYAAQMKRLSRTPFTNIYDAYMWQRKRKQEQKVSGAPRA